MKTLAVAMGLFLFIGVASGAEEKKRVPAYTNDDLARVAPFKDQTGVTSTPAVAPAEVRSAPEGGKGGRARSGASSARQGSDARAGRGEAYWRKESERVRERIRPVKDSIEELRLKIEERRRKPGVRPYSDPQVQAWERRVQTLQDRIREWESTLEDRARREGALPGWLR